MHKGKLTYLEHLENLAHEHSPILARKSGEFLEKLFGHSGVNGMMTPSIFVLDYVQRKYLYVHPSCKAVLGYSADYFSDGGFDAFLDKWYKTDLVAFSDNIFPKNVHTMSGKCDEDLSKYLFTHSLRFRSKNGDLVSLLQKYTYILDDNQLPIGAVGYLEDVTGIKSDDKIVHIVQIVNRNSVPETIYKASFLPDGTIELSSREKEVLKWICEGLTSKEIAGKLSISTNTVNNHRKNMLSKTGRANTAELLKYAILNGLI